jgi:di/tricarboxylate transporter
VATLLPVVVVAAYRLQQAPSKLLIPLNFASFAGSMLALTGSPVNVLVADASDGTGNGFGFFEFSLVGVPLLAGTLALTTILSDRLLPQRSPRRIEPDLSNHAHTLVEEYLLRDGIAWLRVRVDSQLLGKRPDEIETSSYESLVLLSVKQAVEEEAKECGLAAGDVLIVQGPAESVRHFANDEGLGIRAASQGSDNGVLSEQVGLAEVVIPPRSALIGESMFPGMVNDRGNIVVLAIRRGSAELGPKESMVRAGDTLLLQGSWNALDESLGRPDVLLVDSPEVVRRQALPLGATGKKAIAVLAGMVVLLATGVVQTVVAGLLAAGAMVVLGVIKLPEAYRTINWTAVILVAAMIPFSTAMSETGAAEDVSQVLVNIVGDSSPYLLLAGLFLLTAGFSQLISSTATALIMIPVSLSGAAEMGISPQPVLMTLAIAAVSSFLTPVTTPVNLMIMEPGGYQFGDYWKLGLPLLLFYGMVAVFIVPIFWPF